jgi:hypothetical protein
MKQRCNIISATTQSSSCLTTAGKSERKSLGLWLVRQSKSVSTFAGETERKALGFGKAEASPPRLLSVSALVKQRQVHLGSYSSRLRQSRGKSASAFIRAESQSRPLVRQRSNLGLWYSSKSRPLVKQRTTSAFSMAESKSRPFGKAASLGLW